MNAKIDVLLVDDDPDFRKIISRVLKANGYSPISTASGGAALSQVSQSSPSVALIDIRLREMNGLEAMEQIKKYCPDIECIILTGHASQESAIKAIELGAFAYQKKPCDIEQLLVTIQQAIEKRAAKKLLQKSVARFEQVVTSISDHIYVTEIMENGNRRNVFISPHVEALTGYPRDKFLSDWRFWPTVVIHPDDQKKAATQAALVAEGHSSEAEYRLMQADGGIIWVRDSATTQEQETSILIYGVVSDITRQKQVEATLIESEGKYRSLFSNMVNAYAYHRIEVDDKGQPIDYVFLEINDAFERLTGLKKEIIGKRVTEVIPNIRSESWIDTYGKVALTGANIKFEQYSDTLERWYSVSAYSPQKYYFVTNFDDITEQKQAREKVDQLNEGLEKRVSARTRELSALYEITALGGEEQHLDTLLTRVLARTLMAVEGDAGFIHLMNESEYTLPLAASQGLPPETVTALGVISADTDWAKRVLEYREPLIIPDVQSGAIALPEIRLTGLKSWFASRLRTGGQTTGVLSVLGKRSQQFNVEEVTLLTSISDQIAGEVEKARLREQANEAAIMEERSRLARELHDSATQSFYSLTLFAEAGRELAETADKSTLRQNFERMREIALHALKEMRMLVHKMAPPDLHEVGLVCALRTRLNAVEERLNINTKLVGKDLVDLPAHVEENLYRIAIEALNNSLKHAKATSVTVALHSGDGIVLEIIDDGIGFEFEVARNSGGLGLGSIQSRVEDLKGMLIFQSEPGKGTRMKVMINHSEGDK